MCFLNHINDGLFYEKYIQIWHSHKKDVYFPALPRSIPTFLNSPASLALREKRVGKRYSNYHLGCGDVAVGQVFGCFQTRQDSVK